LPVPLTFNYETEDPAFHRMTRATIGFAGVGLLSLVVMPRLAQDQPAAVRAGADTRTVGRSIADVLREEADFSAFRMLVTSAGLAELFVSDGPYTVFVPLDSAFALLSDHDLATLLEGPRDAELLYRHVLVGVYTVRSLQKMLEERGGSMTLKTLAGGELVLVHDSEGAIVIDGLAGITQAATVVGNGAIMPIDHVLATFLREE
jgi:uncharacterized surface protein with fasciclin (FAS1) repeats